MAKSKGSPLTGKSQPPVNPKGGSKTILPNWFKALATPPPPAGTK